MLPLLIPRATQGRNALAWGLVCSPWGREGLGLAGLQLRGAQGGGNQRQPCGPCFHLPASKRCKQTLSPCQAATAPSLRPQPAFPSSLLLLPGKPAATHLRAPQRGRDSWPLRRKGEALPGREKEGSGTLTPIGVPTVGQAGSWRLTHPCHPISLEPSRLEPAVQSVATRGYRAPDMWLVPREMCPKRFFRSSMNKNM